MKLTVWMVVISLVIQLTLGVVVFVYQRSSIGTFINSRIGARADTVASAIVASAFSITDDDLKELEAENRRFTQFDTFILTLYRDDGSVVASNVRPAPVPAEIGIKLVSEAVPEVNSRQRIVHSFGPAPSQTHLRTTLRFLAGPNGERFILLIAITDSAFETMTEVSGRGILLTIVVGTIATAIAGWFIAGLAVSPITHLRRIAGSLTPESIDREMSIPTTSREMADLERDLEDARARLRHAFQTQDRFISNVSHELKTPIAVLLTEAQTLSRNDLPEHGKKFVQSVTDEIRRLGRTIESFLTLTKVRAGKALVNAKSVDMNDVIVETAANCFGMARQHHVQINPQLVESDTPITVVGDQELLRVMLDNLVRNAIRFSPQNEQVVIRVQRDGAWCIVHVRDSGPGICDDLLPKIFDRFVQAEEESVRGRGHGLGLSIAQGIAELHGGKIAVRNVPEALGCEFSVRLPIVMAAFDEDKVATAST